MTAPRHVELGLGRGLLAIPGMGELGTDGEMRLGVFLWVGLLIGNVAVFFAIFAGAGTAL